MTKSYRNMVAWLYAKGDDCSFFQKNLRIYMFLNISRDDLLALIISGKK